MSVRDGSPRGIWDRALGQLELQVSRPQFETWLRNTEGLDYRDEQLVVGVPTDFAVEWLRTRMSDQVDRAVSKVLSSDVRVLFQVLGAPSLTQHSSPNGQAPNGQGRLPRPDLNRTLTFDAFTVVKSNRLAFRAARRIASGDGRYNPLLITGEPGFGKTHLLHAIGHEATAAGRPVLAFTGDTFVTRYSNSARNGSAHVFRELFDDCSLLLLDDLPFLCSRSGSVDLFSRVLDSLLTRGCQVVLTAHLSPGAISSLPSLLRSRLAAGLTTELHLPSEEERLQILKAKSAALARPFPARLLQTIARQPYHSVRELEGALNRAEAFAELTGGPMSEEDLLRALYPLEPTTDAGVVSAEAIVSAVAEHFQFTPEQVAGPSRSRDVSYARHVAIYFLRRQGSHPLAQIGSSLGGRDHSTVLSGFKRIERELRSLPQTRADIEAIEQRLRTSSAA